MNNIAFSNLSQLQITQHAALRMAQRNVSANDLHFVLRHGQKLHRAGAIIFFCASVIFLRKNVRIRRWQG